ncbi:MAG: hypothetical protein QXP02_05310 [Desulfurococcaceae archaeon]
MALKPIVLIPFASEIHEEKYYGNVFEFFKKLFTNRGVVVYEGVITSSSDAVKVAEKYRDHLPIALVLTGGTSGFVYDFATSAPFDKLFILGHIEHNSLASAISIRGKIEREGFSAGIYWCDINDPVNCELVVDKLTRITRAASFMIGSRVLVVADKDKGDVEEAFESRFNSTVDMMSISELARFMETINKDEVRETIAEIEDKYIIEAPRNSLEKVSRLYLALGKIARERGYDVVTIDCFPFIVKYKVTPCLPLSLLNDKGHIAVCEADLTAVAGMMLARALTGLSGWIGNAVWFKSRQAMFAHCTIALDIALGKPRLISHFESNYPYAVASPMKCHVVTAISMDRDFTYIAIERGKVVKSGLMVNNTCRTQVLLEFDQSMDHVPVYAPSNHHVLIPGDHVEELLEIARIFNMDAVMYRELPGIT